MSRLRDLLRARLDWVPGAHRPQPLRIGAAALAGVGLVLVIAFTGWIPFVGKGGRLVRAEFATAEQVVVARTPVRVGGVEVGRVERVDPGPADPRGATSVVVMRISDDDLVVRRDAAAHIRFRTILGGTRYVDLDAGSPSAPPLGDTVISRERTGSQVDWDDFNQPYGRETRMAQRDVLKGLRETFAAPRRTGRTLERLGPALSVIGRGAESLRGREPGDLPRLVAAAAGTVDALSREQGALEGLVDGAERTLAVTAGRRRELGQMVELSPHALDATTTTMRRLLVTLDHLDPLVADLRPGARALAPATRSLRPGLRETERLLRASAPLLRDARPALVGLAATGRQGVPLIAGLSPTVQRLKDELLPFLRRRDDDTKLRTFEAIGPTFSLLSSFFQEFDDEGTWFHFATPAGPDSVVIPCGPDLNPPETKRCDALNKVLPPLFGGPPR